MKSKPVLVFDFDGVIADSFGLVAEIYGRLASEIGFKWIDPEQIRELGAKRAIKYSQISPLKLPSLLKRVREEMAKGMAGLKPLPGIKVTLEKLKKAGFRLGVLSSNSQENIFGFLTKHHLQLFDFFYSASSLLGKDKIIKNLLKDRKLKPEEIIYIGDEVRDVEAAQKAKVKVMAVSWGYNSKKILAEAEPDFLIDKPEEMLSLLERG